jgi:hypothetical protein
MNDVIVKVVLREKGENNQENRMTIIMDCLRGAEKKGYTTNYLNTLFMERKPVYFKFGMERAKEFQESLNPRSGIFDVIVCPDEPAGGFYFP